MTIRERLSRVTSTGLLIPEIDGLRFIAICAVVLFHLQGYVAAKSTIAWTAPPSESLLAKALAQGNFGVQLFFIISGFIIALPFAEHYLAEREPVSLKRYFLRRLTRLEPPYIINLGLVSFALLVTHKMSFSELLPHLAASLVYLHTFLYKAASEINFAAWSLEVEIQFYIAAPLLCRVFSIRSVRLRRGFLILAMMAAATGQQFWLAHQPAWLRLTLLDSISYFLVGFLLVDFFIVDWKKQPSRSFRWDLISGAAWLALVPLHYFHVADPYLLPAVCAVAYTGAFRGRLLGVGLHLPWIVALGGMCYTIYLYHYQVISVLGRVLLSWGWTHAYWSYLLWQIALFAPPLFLCAALLFVWFEKPFMAKRWWKPS